MKTGLKLATVSALLLLALPAAAQAQFACATNNFTTTFADDTGSGGALNIPSRISGFSVKRTPL